VNSLLDALDRYKYGLVAALATMMLVFMLLKMLSHTEYYKIEAFPEYGRVEMTPEEEIQLQASNIMAPTEDVKNMSRDENDQRERSNDNYSQNSMTADEMVQSVYDMERQMYADAGGEAEREEIRKMIEERKRNEQNQQNNSQDKPTQSGGDNAPEGSVMVSFNVPKHTAYQGNNWYVRNPGYTCPQGSSGVVTVMVRVDQSGNVISATYDPAQSSGANSCMIQKAEQYAKKSRFNFNSSAAKSQQGWIKYTFVSG